MYVGIWPLGSSGLSNDCSIKVFVGSMCFIRGFDHEVAFMYYLN